MHFISRVIYHFFNILFRIALVVAGLAILVIGINIFSAKAADSANEMFPGTTHVAYHIELPGVIPDWIRDPVNTLQSKAEGYFAKVLNLNDLPFLTVTPTQDTLLNSVGSETPDPSITVFSTGSPEATETPEATDSISDTETPVTTDLPGTDTPVTEDP